MAHPVSIEAINKKLVALTNRVGFLERALREARRPPSRLPVLAAKRDNAEHEARRKALDEYWEAERVEMYRSTPGLAARIRESERRRNKFLADRGLKPDPTQIPKELRKRR
jgi:hypothetical protein